MPEPEAKTPLRGTDYVLLVVLAMLSIGAAIAMGLVLGWMTGASESPVGNAAISGVFGILGAVGTVKVLQESSSGRVGIVASICIAAAIVAFCGLFYVGLLNGSATRNKQSIYKRSSDLIGERWAYLDRDIVAEVNAYRMQSRSAGVKSSDYEAAMIEVVRPIVNDDKSDDKLTRLRRALAILRSGFQKPSTGASEPKADEKLKAEPAKEPPTGGKAD